MTHSLSSSGAEAAADDDAVTYQLSSVCRLPGPRPQSTVEGLPQPAAIPATTRCSPTAENTCLVAPSGAVEWLCLPLSQDPSVFGTLLDRSAGSLRLGPPDAQVPASRRYLPGTKVLETTWQTRTGWLIIQDFMAVGPWHRTRERSALHRRTPGDFDADHVLIRIATSVHGSVELVLDCELAFDYGRTDTAWQYTGAGYNEVATATPGPVSLRLTADLRLGHDGRAVQARHRMQAGESCFVALGWGTLKGVFTVVLSSCGCRKRHPWPVTCRFSRSAGDRQAGVSG